MEDYYCWSNKASGDAGNHYWVEDLLPNPRNSAAELTPFAPLTGDSRLGLARSPPVLKRPHVAAGNIRTDWTKAFLNQRYRSGSSDVGGAGLIGWTCSGTLPSIPEERELENDGGGEVKKGKEIILVRGDGKRVVTATDELVKDLQAQFSSLEELPDATSAQLADGPDYKRRRRLLLNRLSAQRSRQRKLQVVADKTEMVKMLEVEVEAMKPQINGHEERQKILGMANLMMKSRISALEKRAQRNTIEIEEKQAVIRRLKEELQAVWMQQGAPHLQHQPLAAVPGPASQSTTAYTSAGEAGTSDGGGSRLPDIPIMPEAAEEEEEASSKADDPMEA